MAGTSIAKAPVAADHAQVHRARAGRGHVDLEGPQSSPGAHAGRALKGAQALAGKRGGGEPPLLLPPSVSLALNVNGNDTKPAAPSAAAWRGQRSGHVASMVVGPTVGDVVGRGDSVGCGVGRSDVGTGVAEAGAGVGTGLGAGDGGATGLLDRRHVGWGVGTGLGCRVGCPVGAVVGAMRG